MNCKRLLVSFGLTLGVLALLTTFSGTLPNAVVYADPVACNASVSVFPCTIGANLEIVSEPTGSLPAGTGGPCLGTLKTTTFLADPTNPGVMETGTACSGGAGSGTNAGSESLSLLALNGYEIDDLSLSLTCSTTGGDVFSETINGLTVTCAEGTGSITFAPVTNLTVDITLSNTATSTGSYTVSDLAGNFSLVATPEPSSLLLLGIGLLGLCVAACWRKNAPESAAV